ncbi:MAG: RDD family protein [Casimicrobium sp.]
MRSSSIYEALEVNPTSPTDRIQASLRSVLRRFWAVPRDASGDTEEAVRFAALAAAILVDPIRRKDYDAALSPGVGSGPWRLPVGGSRDTTGEAPSPDRVGDAAMESSRLSVVGNAPKFLPGVDALADPLPEAVAWASPAVWLAALVSWLILWVAIARPFSSTPDLPFFVALSAAVAVAAVVVLAALWISQSREVPVSAASLSRLAVIKWRREGSIFLGNPPPQHDTAWIFKLRLMELTRSAAGYVTATGAWRRFAARLFDYALVALILFAALALAESIFPAAASAWLALRSPLILPTLAVLACVPIESALYARYRTTLGKWLFGMVVVTGASRPSDHVQPTAAQLAWTRAWRVAWVGAAAGFLPVAVFRFRDQMQKARDSETDWDAGGDAVIMGRPTSVPAVVTALFIMLAAISVLASAWRDDFKTVQPNVKSLTQSWTSSIAGLWSAGEKQASEIVAAVSKKTAGEEPAPTTPVAAATSPTRAATASSASVPTPVRAASESEVAIARLSADANQRRVRIEGYIRQTETARRTGNYAASQSVCQRWADDQPANAQAWQCLGLAQFQNGAGRAALPALRQSLKLEANDPSVEAAILKILRP